MLKIGDPVGCDCIGETIRLGDRVEIVSRVEMVSLSEDGKVYKVVGRLLPGHGEGEEVIRVGVFEENDQKSTIIYSCVGKDLRKIAQ